MDFSLVQTVHAFDAASKLKKPTILVVDDSVSSLDQISAVLQVFYQVKVATGGAKALEIAGANTPPDLILLDVMMPGLSGYQVCKKLKDEAFTRDIPVIFLTANSSVDDEASGLLLGAADFIAKPVNPPILLARVATQMQLKAAADRLRDQNDHLEREVQKRSHELAAIQDVTIHAMASLAETRDNETGNHIRRTQNYIRALALRLRHHERFRAVLDNDLTIDLLYRSAPLHDIGKVGIPDRILLKPGRLTQEEFEVMKSHTTLGLAAIESAENQLDLKVDFLLYAKEIAYSHHEKWDGTGYPLGLAGDAIPVSARLMAVADFYDALISRRVYKQAMSHAQAMQALHEGRGSHFDPDVVDACDAIQEDFQEIARRYSDTELASQGLV
ncbi:two-component system response regulator [Synechococcus sp. CBW1006]|uniref:response regulator n=1 Tax=Synechococcus sp. CBW1006 TaxID=1353138 RepID=UPI0018CDFB69|nr:two-component system response regulator [Synechococcus sp. CBW1006]QPN67745.1 two-component system response regulator [Synechococcus sp. CBW1006]